MSLVVAAMGGGEGWPASLYSVFDGLLKAVNTSGSYKWKS